MNSVTFTGLEQTVMCMQNIHGHEMIQKNKKENLMHAADSGQVNTGWMMDVTHHDNDNNQCSP